MSKELAVELVRQAGGLLGALVWAGLALTLVIMFRKQIVVLLDRNLSFEGLGVKVAVSRAANADAAVRAAEAKSQAEVEPGSAPQPVPGASVAPQALDVLLDRTRAKAIGSRRILWVDDNPANNADETRAFRELGIQVDQATDTDAAIARLQSGDYDLVISDLARGGESEAGLILMRTMRADNIDAPVVIYTSAHGARFTQEARAAGAMLVTSSPTTLFQAVVRRLAA